MLMARKPPPGVRCTPGVIASRELKSRPLRGTDSILALSTQLLLLGDDSTKGAVPSTSMVSLRCPTSREKLELVSEPVETSTFRCDVLKPANVTATRYVPMGRSLMRKLPLSLVVVVRVTLVPTFSALTATLGTTAPELSVTIPAISPVIFCANTGPARHRLTRSRKNNPP